MNRAGNGVAEFDLRIADAVSTDHRAARLHHLAQPAGENLLEYLHVALLGEADQGQRRDRPAAHGINIAERVGGRDLAEGVGVVDDGREEVHRLHQRQLGRELIHSGVVGFVEAD